MGNDEALAFEDLSVGQQWTSPPRVITAEDIARFASLTGDHTPIHHDAAYAAQTPFGRIIAHGLLGLSVLAGLSSEHPRMRTTALLGVSDWQFNHPIHIGDRVHVETEVLELASRGRRYGEVRWFRRLINQNNQVTQQGILVTLVEARTVFKRRVDAAKPAVATPIVADRVELPLENVTR